jgi:peptide/nickel transport system permease protein
MIAAPAATLIAAFIGTLLGLLTGYFKGWIDEIISRLLEAILSIPSILLAIVIVFTFGPTNPVIIGTIAFLFIPPIARTVRAATLAEAQLDYVTAARMRGEGSLFIISREIFPNVVGVVIVEVTVRLGYAIFTLTTLAFLGLAGGNITDPNWGIDVAQNYQQVVAEVWWPTVFPALAIGSLVIGVNLIADSIERATKS